VKKVASCWCFVDAGVKIITSPLTHSAQVSSSAQARNSSYVIFGGGGEGVPDSPIASVFVSRAMLFASLAQGPRATRRPAAVSPMRLENHPVVLIRIDQRLDDHRS